MIGCRCPSPPARAWRFMAKLFCVSGFAAARDASRCSGSARTVIADSAIAARLPHAARRQQRRAANRRHQRSPEGRLDHRDRQRAYRRRQAPRARDGSMFPFDPFLRHHCLWECDHPAGVVRCQSGSGGWSPVRPWLRCIVCGRTGYWVDPFPQIPPSQVSSDDHPETRAEIRRYFFAEHWKIGTIAHALWTFTPIPCGMPSNRTASARRPSALHPRSVSAVCAPDLWSSIPGCAPRAFTR